MAESSHDDQSMPPPPSRTPSQASRKRRAPDSAADDTESQTSKRSRRASSSSTRRFSEIVRRNVMARYNSHCWHCRAPQYVQAAHVLAQGDNSLERLRQRGMLSLEHYNDDANALPLCPNCHAAYDNSANPSLLIVPSTLDFFVRHEQRWQDGLKAASGRKLPRVPPTRDEYQQHCHVAAMRPFPSVLEPRIEGGFYTAYVHSDYFPAAPTPSLKIGRIYASRLWHGDPMAILGRAIASHTTMLLSGYGGLPEDVVKQLSALNFLYLDGDKLWAEVQSADEDLNVHQSQADTSQVVDPSHPQTHTSDRPPPPPPVHHSQHDISSSSSPGNGSPETPTPAANDPLQSYSPLSPASTPDAAGESDVEPHGADRKPLLAKKRRRTEDDLLESPYLTPPKKRFKLRPARHRSIKGKPKDTDAAEPRHDREPQPVDDTMFGYLESIKDAAFTALDEEAPAPCDIASVAALSFRPIQAGKPRWLTWKYGPDITARDAVRYWMETVGLPGGGVAG